MSRESILKIQETEEEAERLIAEARELAKKLVADAQRNGKESLRVAEEESRAAAAEMLGQIRERTAQLGERLDSESQEACEELRRTVQLRRKAAEKVIMRGVEAKCRFVQ